MAEFGQGQYAFVHKTFQEYLTAQEIREQQEEGFEVVQEHFERHLHDPHWREVLLLVFAQQKRSNPAKVLRLILKLDDPYEKYLHRNLLFAASCLAEDVDIDDEALVGEILDQLHSLAMSESKFISYTTQQIVSDLIICLGDTQFSDAMLQRLKSQPVEGTRKFFFIVYCSALGGEEASVLEELFNLLSAPEPDVRSSMAEIVGQLPNVPSEVVIVLLNLLNDDHSNVRLKSARALGRLGNNSLKVVNALLNLLNNNDLNQCSEIMRALKHLDNPPLEVMTTLLNLLNNDNPDVRSEVAEALGQLGNDSPEVMIALLNLLDDDHSFVRSEAIEGLSQLLLFSTEIRTKVIFNSLSLLNDNISIVRSNAAKALGRLSDTSLEVITGLLNLFDDDTPFVRSTAAEALGELGKQSIDKIQPLLIQWIEQHPDSEGIGNAIDALWLIVTK